jgi:hypothetical protein
VGEALQAALRTELPPRIPAGFLPDGFMDELQEGILRSLYAQRENPPNAERFIQKTAHTAFLLLRQRDGQLAVEELAREWDADLRDCFRKTFLGVPFTFEDLQPTIIRNLQRSTPRPERAATFRGYLRTVLINAGRDERGERSKEIAESALSDRDQRIPPLDRLAARSPQIVLPVVSPGSNRKPGSLKLEFLRLPFHCPPNPPHQSLAWAYKVLLDKAIPALIKESCADLPLRHLHANLLERLQDSEYSKTEWESILEPVRKVMDSTVGAVLVDPKMRAAYQDMLARTCGDTCLRDYKTDDVVRAEDGESPRGLEDKLLARNISNWIEAVQRRSQRHLIETVMALDQHEG